MHFPSRFPQLFESLAVETESLYEPCWGVCSSDGVCTLSSGRCQQQMLAGRQASTQSQSPEHAGPGTLTLGDIEPRSAAGWWRECTLMGKLCSKALLMSLCCHAVFSACHHGWDSAACLLLRVHWHLSGAYPRILLSGWRLNEALPGDGGGELHQPSGALLCSGCHPNCYCKYRISSLLSDTWKYFLSAFSPLSCRPGLSPANSLIDGFLFQLSGSLQMK